jgi:hypothetical protein
VVGPFFSTVPRAVNSINLVVAARIATFLIAASILLKKINCHGRALLISHTPTITRHSVRRSGWFPLIPECLMLGEFKFRKILILR